MADGVKQVETVMTAAEVYEIAHVNNVWMDKADDGIHLFGGQVIENDSAGAGRSDDEGRVPFSEISGDMAVKKTLHLEMVPPGVTRLAFIGQERKGHQATLRFRVNGHEVLRRPSEEVTPEAKQYWIIAKDDGAWNWSRWYYVDLPEGCLTAGENEIVVDAVDGHIGWSMMVADYRDFDKGGVSLDELPESSTIRPNGSQTWAKERGEYVLRLSLTSYRKQGEVVSEAVDVAGEGDVKSQVTVSELTLSADCDVVDGTELRFEVRSSTDPRVDAEGWSDWQAVTLGEAITNLQGRYVQWRACFSSVDGAQTPVLKAVTLVADVAWQNTLDLRVMQVQNAKILRTSLPYEYEDYTCEMLQTLRKRFELDAVVAGAQTEFELIEKLMRWAYFVPLGECRHYPWDVLDWLILERNALGEIVMNTYEDRRRDKMCLFPGVVLVAACLSFGIPARHVNFHSEGMTGHEIAEAWSNDYRKWVHLDPTRDYYWYDLKTRLPLDTLEIHEVLMDRLDDVERWDKPYLFKQDLDELVADLPIVYREGDYELSAKEGALFMFRSFSHFRMIPRNNMFSKPGPLPVSQGTEVWAWDGYVNWADEKAPPLLHFNGHTNRRADFYPTMNQTRFTVTQGNSKNELDVVLETDMPEFVRFEKCVDQNDWEDTGDAFGWLLHEGVNVLNVRGVNTMGVRGIVSSVVVEV